MNQPVQPPVYDDEIDLFELAQDIWREKVLVVLVGAVVTLGALGYALMATPVYQAAATVVPPSAHMVHDYNEGRKEAKLAEFSVNDIYKEFTSQLTSRTLRLEFFEDEYLPSLDPQQAQGSRSAQLKSYNQILTVKQADAKNSPLVYQVQFQLDDPELAARWANLYVSRAEQKAKQVLKENINSELQMRTSSAQTQVEALRAKAQADREDEMVRLKEALYIADSIGLSNPTQPSGKTIQEVADYVDRNQLYLRGSKALRSQLEVLSQRKSDDAFIPELRELLSQIDFLRLIKVNDDKVTVMLVDEHAEAPDTPIKPKKTLIVAVGVALGGMLGIFAALVRSAIRKRKSQQG